MRFTSTLSRGVTLACALLLATACPALAASGDGENTPLNLGSTAVHHASSTGGAGILRTIIALAIVIALIYAIARVLKAVKGREARATGDGLTHLATLPLAQGKSVALVRSGSDIVLVGVADSGVTPIKTYTEAEAVANGLISPYEDPSAPAAQAAGGQTLIDSLRRMTVRT